MCPEPGGKIAHACEQPAIGTIVLFAQGLGNTTMFCGDGINDLAALSAADVGMSIGATDAFIAAAISTPQGSVAGRSWKTMAWHCCAVFIVPCNYWQMQPCLYAKTG